MGKELEIKFSLNEKDFLTFVNWIEANASFVGTEKHEEWYMDNPNNTFLFHKNGMKDADNYLRIRKTNTDEASVNLKLWQPDSQNPGHHTHCIEHEFETSDLEATRALFLGLGYEVTAEIQKTRKIYNYNEFEIVIDDVKDLGIFIEVELKEDFQDPKQGHQNIKLFLKSTGIEKIIEQVRGYVSMQWNPDHDLGNVKYMRDY